MTYPPLQYITRMKHQEFVHQAQCLPCVPPPAQPPRQASPLDEKLGAHAEAIASLEKTAIDLRERLDFVMRPPVPAACVSSGKLEDSHAICAAVDAFSSRIREIEVILEDIRSRLLV